LLITLTGALLLNILATILPVVTERILPSWQNVPQLLAFDPQGSIGKWPGGQKPPSLIVTVVVVLALAGAVIGFILYARKQKEAELRAAQRLRRNRNVDGDGI
jgi:hypothetical protein